MPNKQHKIDTCLELIKNNNILVLATQGEPGPYTSLMTYASSEDRREIFMVSSKHSHKWDNIMKNTAVSLLIDNRDGKIETSRDKIKALTITGNFIPVSGTSQREEILESIAKVNPAITEIFAGPECGIIRIKAISFLLLDGPEKAFNFAL
ncbi:pyridoxamine 5'-phosphate oxidase family protein [Maridesulfovibrio frigidus]|uniref:pyridoxamine 5'-phosphate oxidase family protein n=1 Tax=Maridesulfovibrio frigidus TaxID=340956 RepID=UPI00055291D5|nr:pyridoxamine 5'-phosphate oxidase family protein [Maridesulfovibrio frigidus]